MNLNVFTKPQRKQRKHHAKETEKILAVNLVRDGLNPRDVARKHKVTIQTIYKWTKSFPTTPILTGPSEEIKETWDPQDINEIDNYINECNVNPECIHSIELGPDAYEKVLHLCKIEERSIDGQIRYLIKQAYAAQCNKIPF